MTNGHLMHSFVDDEGIKRQAFYSCTDFKKMPNSIASLVGRKRSREKAGQYAMQVRHFRDYAFTQVEGGNKGEKFDYILVP